MAEENDHKDTIVEFKIGDYTREVEFTTVKLSKLVTDAVAADDDEDDGDDTDAKKKHSIPLVNTTAEVLEKVIEFCKHYEEDPMTAIQTPFPKRAEEDDFQLSELVQQWYAEFIKFDDDQVLFQLLISANFMNIKPLLDLSCLAVAKYIHKKSIDEIRAIFKIEKPKAVEEKRKDEDTKKEED